MRFDGFSVGNFAVDKNNQAGQWLWGQISKVNSKGLILKGLGAGLSALSPIKEKKVNLKSNDRNDKLQIEGGIKKGDVVGWHRSANDKMGDYNAVIKISIQGTEATCVDFDEKTGLLAVGCKNGYIFVYSIDQEKIGEQSLYYEIQAHGKDKVMDLYIDSFRGPEQGYLYSIGEDKCFNSYNLSEKKLVQNINVAKSRPTLLSVDGPRGVIYIATRKGGVVVFDLSTLEVNNPKILTLTFAEK
jgi:hypothetical protein